MFCLYKEVKFLFAQKALFGASIFFSTLGATTYAGVMPADFGDGALSKYVEKFNAEDSEPFVWEKSAYPNSAAEKFLIENAPRFDCPDEDIESAYWFRWWTFRKHIIKSPDGFVISEFLRKVPWSSEYGAISCPAAHQIREARWLKNSDIARDYINFWSKNLKRARYYSFWFADSAAEFFHARGAVDGEIARLYPSLKENLAGWTEKHFDKKIGAFWIADQKDGMEISVSGALNMRWEGYRPTINSYMFAENRALAKFAKILGNADDASLFSARADSLKKFVNEKLWDEAARFYKVVPRNGTRWNYSHTREQLGYVPWYFGIPPAGREDAWLQIKDEAGFKAPFGLTTAERRSPFFQISYIGHECQWNGPVWPYSTTMTLDSLANLLNDYPSQKFVSKGDFYDALRTYAKSHRRTLENGKTVFWLDENQNPFTGEWISRKVLSEWVDGSWYEGIGGKERGKDYNHSAFADIVITGLVGVRLGDSFSGAQKISINPLVPESWNFFCLDELPVFGGELCVMWDKDGTRYGKGAGFQIFLNGERVFKSEKIERAEIEIK